MDGLDVNVPESDYIIQESLGIRLVNKKRGLKDGSDSEMISRKTSGIEAARGTRL